jgi:hypothetical protein
MDGQSYARWAQSVEDRVSQAHLQRQFDDEIFISSEQEAMARRNNYSFNGTDSSVDDISISEPVRVTTTQVILDFDQRNERTGNNTLQDIVKSMEVPVNILKNYKSSNDTQEMFQQALQSYYAFLGALTKVSGCDTNRLVPTILYMGGQSAGKSRLLSATIGIPIGFSAGEIATTRPIDYDVLHNPEQEGYLICIGVNTFDDFQDIAPALKEVMDATQKQIQRESVAVQLSSKAITNGIRLCDFPGIIASQEESLRENRLMSIAVSEERYKSDIVDSNLSIAVFATKINDDRNNISWGKIIENHNIDINRNVFCLTHGDEGLRSMLNNNKFDDCTSWKQVWDVISANIREIVKKSDAVIFVTALDASQNTKGFTDYVQEHGFERALINYRQLNEQAHQAMLNTFEDIARRRNLTTLSRDFAEHIEPHLGIRKFVHFIRARQMEAFKFCIEKTDQFAKKVGNMQAHIIAELKQKIKEEGTRTLREMLDDFFEVFKTLYDNILHGTKLDNKTNSPAMLWLIANSSKWHNCRKENVVAMADETAKTKGPHNIPVPSFPFSSDENVCRQKETKFLKRYYSVHQFNTKPLFGATAVGGIRMTNLIMEICARIMWIKPKELTKEDLANAKQNTGNMEQSLEDAVWIVLGDVCQDVFSERLFKYAAHRFPAIAWHNLEVVLSFMQSIPHFSVFFEAQRGNVTFFDDLKKFMIKNVYDMFAQEITTRIEPVRRLVGHKIDSFSAMFFDLCPLLMTYDRAYNDRWLNEHRNHYSFPFVVGMLSAQKKSSSYSRLISMGDRKGVWEYLSGEQKSDKQRTLEVFLTSQKMLQRFTEDEFKSDILLELMTVTHTPDRLRERFDRSDLTQDEIEYCEYVYHRLFDSRRLDCMRLFFTEMMDMTSNLEASYKSLQIGTFAKAYIRFINTTDDSTNNSYDFDTFCARYAIQERKDNWEQQLQNRQMIMNYIGLARKSFKELIKSNHFQNYQVILQ